MTKRPKGKVPDDKYRSQIYGYGEEEFAAFYLPYKLVVYSCYNLLLNYNFH